MFKPKPADSYPLLLKQFNSLVSLVNAQQKQIGFYSAKDYSHSESRLMALEAALESEKNMNAILTEEITRNDKN